MEDSYFVYIDILGFKNLVNNSKSRVDDLYEVIASLNAHQHHAFETIIFSDTILIYSIYNDTDESDENYHVMFSCEMAQDLQKRLVGRDVWFRAYVTYGEFHHYEINDIPCFYGQALNEAYQTEKGLPCIGLLLDPNLKKFNNIFNSQPWPGEENLNYVFVTQALDKLEYKYKANFPLDEILIVDNDLCWSVGPEVMMLENIYKNKENCEEDKVRNKFENTWDLYTKQYPKTTEFLVKNEFSLAAISPHPNWEEIRGKYPEDYSYVQDD